jgi:ferredoxin
MVNYELGEYVEVPFDHPRVPKVRIAKIAAEADAIINVPRMKSHKLTTLSLGIKNCFGMLEKTSRRKVHVMGLDQGIAALYKLFKPAFTLIDGLTVPAAGAVYGEHLRFGVIAASEDLLSLDIVCSRLLGADPADITHVAIARGDRTMQPEVVGDQVEPIKVGGLEDTRRRRAYRNIYRTVYTVDHYLSRVGVQTTIPWFHTKFGIHPEVEWAKCNQCGKCAEICPVEAFDIKKRALDYGRCGRMRCLKCVEVCDPGAIVVKQAFRSS